MTAVNAADELANYTAGQLVTWHTELGPIEMVVVDCGGPWVSIAPSGSDVGFTVHESQVSSR